jgi:hypothetical protein
MHATVWALTLLQDQETYVVVTHIRVLTSGTSNIV